MTRRGVILSKQVLKEGLGSVKAVFESTASHNQKVFGVNPQKRGLNPKVLYLNPKVSILYPRVYILRHCSTIDRLHVKTKIGAAKSYF